MASIYEIMDVLKQHVEKSEAVRSNVLNKGKELLTNPIPGNYPTEINLEEIKRFVTGQANFSKGGWQDTTQGGPSPLDIGINAALVGQAMFSQIKSNLQADKAMKNMLAKPLAEARALRSATAIDVPATVEGVASTQSPIPGLQTKPLSMPSIVNRMPSSSGGMQSNPWTLTPSKLPTYSAKFEDFYTPNTKLPPEDLELQSQAAEFAAKNTPQIIKKYHETTPKNEINADVMRGALEIGGWKKDFIQVNSNAFHEVGSGVKKVLRKDVEERAIEAGKFDALLLAGGPGVGKSHTLRGVIPDKSVYGLIEDSNEPTTEFYNDLVSKGFSPEILFIHRDPRDSWLGVLKRAIPKANGKPSDFRVVPIDRMVDMHKQILPNMVKRARLGNEKISLLENTKADGTKILDLDKAEKISYNWDEVRRGMEDDTIQIYKEGKLPNYYVRKALGINDEELQARSGVYATDSKGFAPEGGERTPSIHELIQPQGK